MSFKKLIGTVGLFIVLVVNLAGCGFKPMMRGDNCEYQSFDVHVKGDGFPTYKFRRELEKHLSAVPKFCDATYIIHVKVGEAQAAASFAQDATVNLTQASAFADYTIRLGNVQINQGHNDIITSFPVVPSDEYITKNAGLSASTRLAISLAEEVARDIVRLIKNPNL